MGRSKSPNQIRAEHVLTNSFKVEVQVHGESGWTGNGLRFKCEEDAVEYARDLFSRGTAVKEWQVIASTDEPN